VDAFEPGSLEFVAAGVDGAGVGGADALPHEGGAGPRFDGVAGLVRVDDGAQRVIGRELGAVDTDAAVFDEDLPDGTLHGAGEGLGAADSLGDPLDEVDVEAGGEGGEGDLVGCRPLEQGDVRAGPFEGAQGAVAVDGGQGRGGP